MATVQRQTNTDRQSVLSTPGSTTHISVVDGEGNAVAVTTSNGETCGWALPGTGILLNNFLGEEDINPAGFHQQPAGEEMLTMMCPTVVRSDEGWTAVLGTGGSNRIRTAILQVVSGLVDHGLSLSEAIDAPRTHVEGGVLNLEAWDLSEGAVADLAASFDVLVDFDKPNMFFGGVHAVRVGPDGVEGAGDSRRGGVFRRVS